MRRSQLAAVAASSEPPNSPGFGRRAAWTEAGAPAGRAKLPDLLAGEGEHGGEEAGERAGEEPESGLGAAAGGRVGGRGVEAVLENVEIDGAEVGGAEGVGGLIDAVEGVFVVPLAAAGDQVIGAGPGSIGRFPGARRRGRVGGRVKAVQIAERVAEGVADLAIGLGEPGEDGHPTGGRPPRTQPMSHPEAQDFGAVLLDDLLGLDGVAERLRHRRPSPSSVQPLVRHRDRARRP
jgi:hypothetical protein